MAVLWRQRISAADIALLLGVICMSALAAPVHGYPCTMYKPGDIARAKDNIARHEWARKRYSTIKARASRYLDMDRDRIRSFIPRQTPLISVKCPVCGNGPWYAYALINNGDALRCKGCGTTWDHDPEDTSETWNIQSVVRTYRLGHVAGNCYALGLVYQIEGDRLYAEKAAVVVERMAEVFKGYRMNKVNANVWLDGNHPYYGKITGWKFRDAGALKSVILAYDLIHDSGVLTKQQREKIDRDLIAYARDYFLEGYGKAGYLGTQSIQDQGYSYWCVAATAALLGDKATLRSIVDMYEQMLGPESWVFYEDGTFFQGTWAYESQFLGGSWSIPEVIKGNLDVDIYSNPKCALLEKVLTWYLDATFPDGTMPAVNDAHVGGRPSLLWSEIAYARYGNQKALRHLREAWGYGLNNGSDYSLFFRDPDAAAAIGHGEAYGVDSKHLTGMGMMILRHGADKPSQTMAFLDYGPYLPAAHKQRDYLNLGLWACGMEMVSEIGYNHNPLWAKRFQVLPIAHNTVLEVGGQEGKGKPLIWCVTPGPKVAEAGLPPANSRLIALLPRAEGKPIVVDIFRVNGEKEQFTWTMHARSGDWQVEGVADLHPVEAPEPLRKGRQGRAAGDLAATWTFAGENPRGLRVLMPSLWASTVTLSECPPEEDEIQATHVGGGALKPGAVIPFRGHIQVTRSGPQAVFVAIHVPYERETPPPIHARWHPVAGRADAVALEISCAGERFIVLHASEPGKVSFGQLSLEGRMAVAITHNGNLDSLCLAAGRAAQYGEIRLSGASTGNAFCARKNGSFNTVDIQ